MCLKTKETSGDLLLKELIDWKICSGSIDTQ